MMDENQNLKYQLDTLASYEPSDIDNPEFEVAYENESGCECFATVCCIDVAQRSLERIKALECELVQTKIQLEYKTRHLSQCETALQERDGL